MSLILSVIDVTARQYTFDLGDTPLIINIDHVDYEITLENTYTQVIKEALENSAIVTIKCPKGIYVFNSRNLVGICYYIN